MPERRLAACAVLVFLAAVAVPTQAQSTTEIEVYSSELVLPKSLTLELHSNYVFRGHVYSGLADFDDRRTGPGGSPLRYDPVCSGPDTPLFQRPPNGVFASLAPASQVGCTIGVTVLGSHALHETLEATTGLTQWADVGAYAFGSKQGSDPARFIGGSVRLRARVPHAWHWPVGIALSAEVEREHVEFTPVAYTLEIRPVIDKAWGRWYASVNPTVQRALAGQNTGSGLEFAPSARVNYDLSRFITAGVEYYGSYGQIGKFTPDSLRPQQFFATVDLHPALLWDISAGVGRGTTSATNRWTAKLIIERRLVWGGGPVVR
jgi:hypothetical protein